MMEPEALHGVLDGEAILQNSSHMTIAQGT